MYPKLDGFMWFTYETRAGKGDGTPAGAEVLMSEGKVGMGRTTRIGYLQIFDFSPYGILDHL